MERSDVKPTFWTENFALSAFLKAKSCKLLQVDKANPRHARFEFEETDVRKKLTADYWSGEALIEPKTFYQYERELKALLYDSSYSVAP